MISIKQIQQSSIFRNLPESDLILLAQNCHERSFEKESSVFNIGDSAEELYLLLSGRVCFELYSNEGKLITLAMAEPPMVIGDMELFDPTPRRSRARVLENTQVCVIPKQLLHEISHRNPKVLEQFLKIYSRRLQAVSVDLRKREDDRLLCRIILENAKRFGTQNTKEDVNKNLAIDLSQETLSSMVGIPRQRINRILNEWKKQGWIDLQYGKIILTNRDALQQFCID